MIKMLTQAPYPYYVFSARKHITNIQCLLCPTCPLTSRKLLRMQENCFHIWDPVLVDRVVYPDPFVPLRLMEEILHQLIR